MGLKRRSIVLCSDRLIAQAERLEALFGFEANSDIEFMYKTLMLYRT